MYISAADLVTLEVNPLGSSCSSYYKYFIIFVMKLPPGSLLYNFQSQLLHAFLRYLFIKKEFYKKE